jgi:hypothetical protein
MPDNADWDPPTSATTPFGIYLTDGGFCHGPSRQSHHRTTDADIIIDSSFIQGLKQESP